MKTEELLSQWISVFTINNPKNILRIQRAEPRFQTHNFFARFKIQTAVLDGTGENPTDVNCLVLEISETDQSAKVATDTNCNSITDL